jgi:hypothetical protein
MRVGRREEGLVKREMERWVIQKDKENEKYIKRGKAREICMGFKRRR